LEGSIVYIDESGKFCSIVIDVEKGIPQSYPKGKKRFLVKASKLEKI